MAAVIKIDGINDYVFELLCRSIKKEDVEIIL